MKKTIIALMTACALAAVPAGIQVFAGRQVIARDIRAPGQRRGLFDASFYKLSCHAVLKGDDLVIRQGGQVDPFGRCADSTGDHREQQETGEDFGKPVSFH